MFWKQDGIIICRRKILKLKIGTHRVLCISDLQEPFAHRDAFDFVCAVRDKYKTDTTVNIGDEGDFHAFSGKFPHDPDGYSPGHELSATITALEKWYNEFPETKVCISNHVNRFYKKVYDAGLPKHSVLSPQKLLEAPESWEWRESWVIDGVKYEHGDNQGGIDAARLLAISNRQSTVIGHHHAHGGVRFIANDDSVIFGLNTGCLIDRHAYAFAYGAGSKFKPTLGCGVVLWGVPYFIPMILSGKYERWIGELI
jgi:hypothetical protein